jgi:hypothetical protein
MFLLKKLLDLGFWIAKVKIEQVVLHWIVFKLTYKIPIFRFIENGQKINFYLQKYILD